MRADRLVEVLLLLQRRGQVTAREVADELEISERTARRDLEALGVAGLPIYSVRGRHGGWRLLGDGRTDLSGLSAPEVRALFMVAGPSNSDPEIRSALRKLVAALPETFRAGAERATEAVVVDRSPWGHREIERRPPEHLDGVQHAVVTSSEVVLGYVDRGGSPSEREVRPLGLASKGAHWYLVADTQQGRRTFRIDRVTSVELTGRGFERPDDFDLGSEWQHMVDDVDRRRAPVVGQGRARVEILAYLGYLFGTRLRIGPASSDGWAEVEVRSQSVDALAGGVAGFGADLELDSPPAVRERLAAIGAALAEHYATS